MKIALLTFHNAYNYGAALQAYALQKTIEMYGISCEYINYVNLCRHNMYDMTYQFIHAIKMNDFGRAIRILAGMPFMGIRAHRFNKFYKKYLSVTETLYRKSEEVKKLNSEYDKFIVGSDQVWNPENNGSDWSYLLDFVDDNYKKNSYSSSFGISEISDKYIKDYIFYLAQFNNLSTGEEKGVQIIKDLTGRDAKLVLDPVFLIRGKDWEKLIKQRKTDKGVFVFFYTNKQGQIKKFLDSGYPMQGKSMHILSSSVGIKDFIDIRKKIKFSMSPLEFIREVRDAEIVVTASFHCVALSIILHKQFCVILTGDCGKDERVINILKITGLESRIIESGSSLKQIIEPINYNHVDCLLKQYIEDSESFLFEIILEQDLKGWKTKYKYFCKDE